MAKITDTTPQAERTTISVTLDAEFYNDVCQRAAEDDRTPAKWLKRFVQQQLQELIDAD